MNAHVFVFSSFLPDKSFHDLFFVVGKNRTKLACNEATLMTYHTYLIIHVLSASHVFNCSLVFLAEPESLV